MNAQRIETIRIEYRLPAQFHNQLVAWQSDERSQFPIDRAHQDRKNAAEFKAKSTAGRIVRRPRPLVS